MILSKFQTRLRVEAIDDTHWRTIDELTYDSNAAGARIIVPAGFETDFASVPRVPIAYWLTGDTAHIAAVVHDFLYTTGIFPKAVADDVFYEAMVISGIPRWRAWVMYQGVNLGGGVAWEIHRRGASRG